MSESSDDLEDWEYPDPDDDPDGIDTIDCPHCGAEIYEESVSCPSCGTWITAQDRYGRGWTVPVTWAMLFCLALALWLALVSR